jgi:hypothetical protein
MKQVALRLDDDLAAKIDQAAGQVPRERWIKNTLRSALEATLSEPKGALDRTQPGPAPVPHAVSAPITIQRVHPQSCKCGVCTLTKGSKS